MNDYQILGFRDIIALFLYAIIYAVTRKYAKKIIGLEFHLFEKGFIIWLIGNSLFFLLFYLYYGWGDTFNYYVYGLQLLIYIFDYPSVFLEVYLSNEISQLSPLSYSYYSFMPNIELLNNHSNFFVAKVTALGLIFTLGSYLTLSYIFTLFSFIGCWLIYTVFRDLYPTLQRILYYSVLLLPNLIFWGNGISKEALYFCGLGLLFYNFYCFFVLHQRNLFIIFFIFLGCYIIISVKSYIFFCFLPSLFLWVLLRYLNNPQTSKKIRILIIFTFIILLCGFTLLEDLDKYISSFAIDTILENAQAYGNFVYELSEFTEGSSYTLSAFEPTIPGAISIIPEALSTALFRPYLWEIRKPINIFNALEGMALIVIILYLFLKIGILTVLKIILKSPDILFCFTFSFIFLVGVSISSLNFGALVRYKLPGELFFVIGLCIIYYNGYLKPRLNEENNTIYYH